MHQRIRVGSSGWNRLKALGIPRQQQQLQQQQLQQQIVHRHSHRGRLGYLSETVETKKADIKKNIIAVGLTARGSVRHVGRQETFFSLVNPSWTERKPC